MTVQSIVIDIEDWLPAIRQSVTELSNLGVDDWREVWENVRENKDDFEVANYRFISQDEIDEIMQDELSGDEYILGCFNAWFIADILGMPCDAVEKIQKAEVFEGLGALMAQKIKEVQQKYVSGDGYGHHFAQYDGEEHEITLGNIEYYAFRVD